MRPLSIILAFALVACGESEIATPRKGVGIEDIAIAATSIFQKPKPKPAAEPALPHQPEPLPQPAPIVVAPVQHAAPAAVKPKSKPKWQKKKTKSTGVAGYSCATVRLAGSAAAVEQMAKARGHVVTAETRRQIQSCFNQG